MAAAQAQTAYPKGKGPDAGVVRDSAGNLYGTTGGGGPENAGVVYEVDAAGLEKVLYSFTGGADGASPHAGVIADSEGNLFSTTYYGGTAGHGVVYELDTNGQETVLYTFRGGADGGYPNSGVIRDSAGNLYGTTSSGGIVDGGQPGAGVVYKVDTAGQETVLYTFTGGADGGYPSGGVIRDSAGNLYGATFEGGTAVGFEGSGVLFKVDTAGQEMVLYTFMGGTDGGEPNPGVIRDSAGNLYGTTLLGGDMSCGARGCGVAYKLDTAGHETVLYSFSGGAGGAFPIAGVVLDSAGNLYGTASSGGSTSPSNPGSGVVLKVDTAGQETVLYTFTGRTDGGSPNAGVVRDSAGNFYGTTSAGGTGSWGVVYKLDTAGHETVLFGFPAHR